MFYSLYLNIHIPNELDDESKLVGSQLFEILVEACLDIIFTENKVK